MSFATHLHIPHLHHRPALAVKPVLERPEIGLLAALDDELDERA